MVDDDFEEGEIEGLINDALQAKVAPYAATYKIQTDSMRSIV